MSLMGRFQGSGRVPYLPQMEQTDCGVACIAMVLAHHGLHLQVHEVRSKSRPGMSSALDILELGQSFGLRGRCLRVYDEGIGSLPRGAILHWELKHFVVFEHARGDVVSIIDPACGRRRFSMAAFRRSFTGVVLVFVPGPSFTRRAARPVLREAFRAFYAGARGIHHVVLLSLLLRVTAVALSVAAALLLDSVVPDGSTTSLAWLALLSTFVLWTYASASFLRSTSSARIIHHVELTATTRFVEHILALPYDFFQRRSAADLLDRIRGIRKVRRVVGGACLSLALDVPLACLYIVALAFVSVPLAGLTLGLVAAQAFTVIVAGRSAREYSAEAVDAGNKSTGYVIDILRQGEAIKQGGTGAILQQAWQRCFRDELNAGLHRDLVHAASRAFLGAIRVGGPFALILLGASLVIDGVVTIGVVIGASSLASAALEPFGAMANGALALQEAREQVLRADDVWSVAPESQAGSRRIATAPAIQLENVSFTHAGMKRPALSEIDIVIPAGGLVVFTGPTGCGKSTLLRMLMGLHRPLHGTLRIDGHPFESLDLQHYRDHAALLTENPLIREGTVRQNIALLRPHATLEEVERAAKLALVHDDIVHMPMAYDSFVADGGSSLSSGQRQRVALARALLTGPLVLLLDEATSCLDAATERRVLDNLRGTGNTVVVVTHRPRAVHNADWIGVMAEGRLLSRGRSEDLADWSEPHREIGMSDRSHEPV